MTRKRWRRRRRPEPRGVGNARLSGPGCETTSSDLTSVLL